MLDGFGVFVANLVGGVAQFLIGVVKRPVTDEAEVVVFFGIGVSLEGEIDQVVVGVALECDFGCACHGRSAYLRGGEREATDISDGCGRVRVWCRRGVLLGRRRRR